MLTQSQLKHKLTYSPTTGLFTWLINPGKRQLKGRIAGSYTNNGYIHIQINKKDYQAHRLAFLYVEGHFPLHHVDHKNGVRDDNKWHNLQNATPQTNAKNRCIRCTNTSGVTGVSWDTKTNKWRSYINNNLNNRVGLGFFTNRFDAICARKSAENTYNYGKSHSRPPTNTRYIKSPNHGH